MENKLSTESKASEPPAESRLTKAGRVANAVTLDYVRFVVFSAERHFGSTERFDEDSIDVPKIRFTRPTFRRSDSAGFTASSMFDCSLYLRGDSSAPEAIATLKARIEIGYLPTGDVPIDENDLPAFVEVNVPFNSWGYWREFVQSSLARLGLPPIVIPLFRVQTADQWMLKDEV